MRQAFHAGAACLWLVSCVVPTAVAADAKPAAKRSDLPQYERMDYGPFLTASITASSPPKNDANKGIAIHLGGKKEAAVCFDTDLLRYSAGWTGGFLDLKGTPFDGSHGSWPHVKGEQQFGTKPGPGWSKPGTTDFTDPRHEPFGPLPADWAKYKGLYLHGDDVVLSYTVGGVKILEKPGVVQADGATAFTRTFNIAPHKESLLLVVADSEVDKAPGRLEGDLAVLGKDKLTVAGLVNAPNTPFIVEAGRILLPITADEEPRRFTLYVGKVAKADLAKFKALLKKEPTPDLEPLTKGGPARWQETVVTQGQNGKDDGPYTVDTITTPDSNPYDSWMRLGGFDFFSDGRIAVCTWSGDVWVVSGVGPKLDKLTWKRFATGLFQPLGLRIVDDVIYTLGREGIVKLHDLNGDGEADFYEAFNNDVATTTGFHEFAFDLQTDPEGNFYYAKAGPVNPGGRGFQYVAAHSGCLLKVSKDGLRHQVYATGFRAPNGIGVGPHGEVVSGDNEGTWMPMCRLSWVLPGSFNGCVDTAHRAQAPLDYDKPICWFPKHIDNSSGGQTWVTSDKWGPLKGELLHTSYGQSSIYHVLLEGSGREVQGGVIRLPVNLLTGVMRPRFSPLDGQLYVAGLRGWQTNAARDGALQRVRYTGQPLNTVAAMKVTHTGLDLTFTNPLDPKIAADPENYSAEQWNYLWREDYGSEDYSTKDPDFEKKVREYNRLRQNPGANQQQITQIYNSLKKGKDKVEIKTAKLSPDGKTVSLEIPGIHPVMQMNLKMNVKTADKKSLKLEIYNTINRVP